MLRVDVYVLERGSVVIDREGPPGSLGVRLDPERNPGVLTLHLEASLEGKDLYGVQGWVRGLQRLECDRCLKTFDRPYRSVVDAHYQRAAAGGGDPVVGEAETAESGVVGFEGDSIDLTEEVRQAVELETPMQAVCREDCRGLCAGCGADLNLESCRCPEPPGDSRWAALKDLKL